MNTAETASSSKEPVSREQNWSRLVELRTEQDHIILRTSARVARRARHQAVGYGVLAMIAGAVLLSVTPWSGALMLGGAVYAAMAPKRFQPTVLAMIDLSGGWIVGKNRVPISGIRAIRGAFETRGWDGFSVISSRMDDQTDVPILMLLGADEELAVAVCAELGRFAGCSAEYIGTTGIVASCYDPPT